MTAACPMDRGMATVIPRYRHQGGPAILSAGFRPFFLGAALWSAAAVPLWLAVLQGHVGAPGGLAPGLWHAHEMIFGFGLAAVSGYLLTAIPNWTGRMPLQHGPLAALVALWFAGRMAMLTGSSIGAPVVATLDLPFPLVFLAAIAREIVAGRSWRNAPLLVALSVLLVANALVHLEALDLASTAGLGIRLGVATLILLISLVGGRIIPSFTGNWLAKHRRGAAMPVLFNRFDVAALAVTAATLLLWVAMPDRPELAWLSLAAGAAAFVRLARWKGVAAVRDPLVAVLHVGYAWIGVGFFLMAASAFGRALPPSAALHAFTAGAIGTMTLAVMTRASLSHTARPLVAGRWTIVIYVLVTLAAVLRVTVPLWPDYALALWLAGAAWSGAFWLFSLAYGRVLFSPRAAKDAPPI